MRQPIEERKVNISRARFSVNFPASFKLVAAMTPWGCVAKFTKPDLRVLIASRDRTDVEERPTMLGGHIRKVRVQRGLLQAEVAKSIGVTANQLCAWEIGKSQIMKVKYFPRILAFLGYVPELEKPQSVVRNMTIVKQIYGWNNKRLAYELEVDPSVIGKWIKDDDNWLNGEYGDITSSLQKLLDECDFFNEIKNAQIT